MFGFEILYSWVLHTYVYFELGLLFGFTLPCGLIVLFCHIYVFIVASRHAKAIKRENSVNDRMRTSVSCKPTSSSEAHLKQAAEIPTAKTSSTMTYLTIPQFHANGNRRKQPSGKNEKRVRLAVKLTFEVGCQNPFWNHQTVEERCLTSDFSTFVVLQSFDTVLLTCICSLFEIVMFFNIEMAKFEFSWN